MSGCLAMVDFETLLESQDANEAGESTDGGEDGSCEDSVLAIVLHRKMREKH